MVTCVYWPVLACLAVFSWGPVLPAAEHLSALAFDDKWQQPFQLLFFSSEPCPFQFGLKPDSDSITTTVACKLSSLTISWEVDREAQEYEPVNDGGDEREKSLS